MSSQKMQSHIGTRHLQHTIQYASPNIIPQHPGSNERTCYKSGIQASQNFIDLSPVAWQLLNQNLQVPLPSLFHLLLPQQSLFGCLLPKQPKMGFEKSKRKITATSRVGQCQYWYAIWFLFAFNSGNMGMYSEHHTPQSRCFYSHLTSPIRLDSHHRTSGTYRL